MSKNILVFSDGTGQIGGLTPDENRSNIYKLYRATRCGSDVNIKANEQIAFYDAGLGSQPLHGGFFKRSWRWLHNLVSKATGLGITTNIIDCYAWIVRVYQPGDRIFLFGFSRGAYTVRCLSGVLSLCGVATKMPNGNPVHRDLIGSIKIAKEAVKRVYQFVSSPEDEAYVVQRKALAANYRNKYSSDDNGEPNVVPFFIGVFDTVASLGSYLLSVTLLIIVALLLGAVSYAQSFILYPFWPAFRMLAYISIFGAVIGYIVTHVKFAHKLTGFSWWQRWHFTKPKMKFYDQQLNHKVWYARHALSIDENRADFNRVSWGNIHDIGPKRPSEFPEWLQQVWFAGNHSDIGGGYSENESRLSDISLDWMVHAAMNLPDDKTKTGNGIKVDERFLQLNPDPCGPQHDEREPGYLVGLCKWRKGLRKIDFNAILHPSVYNRFDALDGVPHFYSLENYRPANLRDHSSLKKYYPQENSNNAENK